MTTERTELGLWIINKPVVKKAKQTKKEKSYQEARERIAQSHNPYN